MVLVRGERGPEVPRVGQAVGADRAELGQFEGPPVVLADVAAGALVQELDPKAHAARDQGDLAGVGGEQAELGAQEQAAALGDDQKLTVRIAEHP